jgi:hypothetical protein
MRLKAVAGHGCKNLRKTAYVAVYNKARNLIKFESNMSLH